MAPSRPADAPIVDSSGVEVRVAANRNTAVSRPSLRMAVKGIRARANAEPTPIAWATSVSRVFLIPADWRFIQTTIQLSTPTAMSMAAPSKASALRPANSPAMAKIAAPAARLTATAPTAGGRKGREGGPWARGLGGGQDDGDDPSGPKAFGQGNDEAARPLWPPGRFAGRRSALY